MRLMKPESDAVGALDQSKASGNKVRNASGIRVLQPQRIQTVEVNTMIRPAITQAIIDNSVEVITENTLDGVGIPYYNEPDGVYCNDADGEDELERARR
jgi:hypothetical protein